MQDRDTFLFCLICMRQYKNKKCYNSHLSRKPHQRKFAKLQLLNDRELIRDKTKWEKWNAANEPKSENE